MAKTPATRASHPGLRANPSNSRPAGRPRPAAQPNAPNVARRSATSTAREPATPRLARDESSSTKRAPGFMVRATKMGYIYHERKRPGDVFKLQYADEFGATWMERVADNTPTKTTTGQEVLRKEHMDTLRERASATPTSVDNPKGGPDPIGVDDDE
jgi:hypothetical protein